MRAVIKMDQALAFNDKGTNCLLNNSSIYIWRIAKLQSITININHIYVYNRTHNYECERNISLTLCYTVLAYIYCTKLPYLLPSYLHRLLLHVCHLLQC